MLIDSNILILSIDRSSREIRRAEWTDNSVALQDGVDNIQHNQVSQALVYQHTQLQCVVI